MLAGRLPDKPQQEVSHSLAWASAGDGKLYNYHIDISNGSLTDRKVISLGTKPISLHSFRSNNTSYVFAASDRPTIIYSNNQKLLYSNLNEDEVRQLNTLPQSD